MGKEKGAVTVAVSEPEELPKTIVRRVVKEKLSEVSNDGADVTLHKEALLAFSESARIFIHYLSATAHDICNESNRQIISAEDVFKALEEIEYAEFVEPLRAALAEFRKKAAGKRAGLAKAKEANKKAKTDLETTTDNGVDKGKDDNEVEEDNEDNEVEEDNEGNEVEEDNEGNEDEEDHEGNVVEDEKQDSEDEDDSDDS